MQELRETDPEEFARLQQLRIDDPSAFRAETRQRLANHRLERLREARPAIYDALMNLGEDDRAWLADRLGRPGPDTPPRTDRHENRPPPGDPQPEALRDLIDAHHAATTDDERAAIRERLRTHIAAEVDRRLAERTDQLRDAEQKLERIRQAIALGEENKPVFIEEKINALLTGRRPPR
jgi:hypothetical protein